MTTTFFCKTTEGYIIKVLSELLQNNIKNGCFIVSESGITFRMTDSNRRILIDINLSADKFTTFKYNPSKDKQLSIGLNLSHFYKMLRSFRNQLCWHANVVNVFASNHYLKFRTHLRKK